MRTVSAIIKDKKGGIHAKVKRRMLPILFTGLLALVAGAALAYVALNIPVDIETKEALFCDSGCTMAFSLYPLQEETLTAVIRNDGPVALDADILLTCSPDTNDLSVTITNKLTVPPTSTAPLPVTVQMKKNGAPQTYSCNLTVDR